MASATKTVRSVNKNDLQHQFKFFLESAQAEEIRFLNNVFEEWSGAYLGAEVGIASAFEYCIARRGEYVRIEDEELLATVTKFLQGETKELSATKARKTQLTCKGATLPAHVKFSSEELALAVRLASVTRHRNYWLGFFIQWLLQNDAESLRELTVKDVEQILADMKAMENWIDYLENLKRKCPAIAQHRAVAWLPENSSGWLPDTEDEQFYELVRLWRKEHPEPPKPVQRPVGRLGRSTDEQ